MKKSFRTVIAFFLIASVLASSFSCFAYELNQDAVALHKGQYENYLLLGDSVASGYRDVITDNDDAYNIMYQETAYCRVPGSYADIIANAIIEDKSMTAFAGPGFRTTEIRYMLEDDFDEEDDYMFHPAQMNAVGEPGSEEYRAAYKKAVAEADLITLGVGGNDWGAYIGWVVSDIMEAENCADKYINEIREMAAANEIDLGDLEEVFEIAHTAGALSAVVTSIPSIIETGLGGFYKNWDIMIQDIYDLNPDVTLMVLGMSDNSVKGNYYDYDGVIGGPVNEEEPNEVTATITSAVVGLILSIGNKPMIDGAEAFGYTYVDTTGTTYVESHPDADGHKYMANCVIEALPHPDYADKFDDVKHDTRYYTAVEFVVMNGIMAPASATTFSPDDALTIGEMNRALNVINGTELDEDNSAEATAIILAESLVNNGAEKNLTDLVKALSAAFKVLYDNNFDTDAVITRGNAAIYFKSIAQ